MLRANQHYVVSVFPLMKDPNSLFILIPEHETELERIQYQFRDLVMLPFPRDSVRQRDLDSRFPFLAMPLEPAKHSPKSAPGFAPDPPSHSAIDRQSGLR